MSENQPQVLILNNLTEYSISPHGNVRGLGEKKITKCGKSTGNAHLPDCASLNSE